MAMVGATLLDPHYTRPIYSKAEASRIIAVPQTTFKNWAVGYTYKTLSGDAVSAAPIVTTAEPAGRASPSIPFIGLAEAYIVSAFTRAGVPMQRIRPAVLWLQEHIGLHQALASERLKTDGAEVLWDFGQRSGHPSDSDMIGNLVVIRSGQGVFRSVVQDYLQRVSYEDGWIRTIELPQYRDVGVSVDPWVNGGQPTIADHGIAVTDIVSRLRAGEPLTDLAYDYDLPLNAVRALEQVA
ncbi:DUF433 domain-containing protein [Actinomadura syzygii]|uniref:DUF433 domain-containing protein n=1 Tax=Actinomadura syzygii TaxID=1427538 RepID=A0A5D0TPJ4_9ACTN|nr:DUF433 domain-containing protein [Actinomadura syzygii]TYC07320.1 DUF433 domain-containing protein [Actinomadura syzygii]